MGELVGFEAFLPIIAATFREKEDEHNQGKVGYVSSTKPGILTDAEFKALIEIVFRDSVITVMRESGLYREEFPIDLYKGIDRYELIAPAGWYISRVIRLNEGNARLPKRYSLDEQELLLISQVPKKDVPKGLYVECALTPTVTSGACKFDKRFIDEYYDIIRVCMEWKFYSMSNRTWSNASVAELKRREYRSLVQRAGAENWNNSAPAVLKYKKLI